MLWSVIFPILVVVSASLFLGGCVNSNISREAVKKDLEKIPNLEQSSTERIFVSAQNIPVFSNISEKTTKKLEIYVTPSCPYCVSLVLGILNQNVIQSKKMQEYAISFFMVPLREADFKIISNLTCISGEKIPAVFLIYYTSILDLENSLGVFNVDDLIHLSVKVVLEAGLTDTELKRCSENVNIEHAVMKNWDRARGFGAGNSWPLVVLNGEVSRALLPDEVLNLVEMQGSKR